jgi:hypothetical protein
MNRFGLSRDIPEESKRRVRQRDGFGCVCVCCGLGIYQYDHFDPEFSEATAHHENGIILLCAACHAKKTKGLLSRDTIAAAAANPRCKQNGFSREAFDVGNQHPQIVFGSIVGVELKCFLRVLGEELFSILPPEIEGGPFRLNAKMANAQSKVIFEICKNEWRIRSDNWDAEQVGQRVIVKNGPKDVALSIRSEPPTRIVVEQLNMQWRGVKILAKEGSKATCVIESGARFETAEGHVGFGDVGIDITEKGIGYGVHCAVASIGSGTMKGGP